MQTKITLLLLFFSVAVTALSAQTISFCTQIDDSEQCKKTGNKFYLSSDKGIPLFSVVRLPEEVSTTQVLFKLYRFDEDDEEVYMTTLTQNVLPQWKTFYKQIVFTRQSGYKIYLYTDGGKLLSSAELSVLEDFGNE